MRRNKEPLSDEPCNHQNLIYSVPAVVSVATMELACWQTLSGWLLDRAGKLYDRLIDFYSWAAGAPNCELAVVEVQIMFHPL